MRRKISGLNLKYRLKKVFKVTPSKLSAIFLFLFGIIIIPIFFLNFSIRKSTSPNIYQQTEFSKLPDTRIGIVYGSSLNKEGNEPGMILKDRLDTAYELYQTGRIQKLILSGYNVEGDYDEPGIMHEYLIEKGIPKFDLEKDVLGIDTYATCFRAKEIYGVSKAILITQEFHLHRAIYLCENLGIESYGAAADKSVYENLFYNKVRELAAIMNAFYEINISPPSISLGEKVAI